MVRNSISMTQFGEIRICAVSFGRLNAPELDAALSEGDAGVSSSGKITHEKHLLREGLLYTRIR